MSDSTLFQVELPAAVGGLRLDQALPRLLPGLSRVAARALCAARAVRESGSGRALGAGVRVNAGWSLSIDPARLETRSVAEQMALRARCSVVTVRHLGATWAAVSKPAGLGSGPAFWGDDLHLAAAAGRLLGVSWPARDRHLPDGGLVHRLDHATSGISIVARDQRSLATLLEQRARGQLVRRYWAWVAEPVDEFGVVDAPIAHHPGDPARMVIVGPGTRRRGAARPAQTTFRRRHCARGLALLEVQIVGGRRHQIRVHLAAIGRPLLGDLLYGGSPAARLGLHAFAVELLEPASAALCRVEDPPPADFLHLAEWPRLRG